MNTWKTEGTNPTIEDCKKYKASGYKLLASFGENPSIIEITIEEVTNNGIIKISSPAIMGGEMWAHPNLFFIHDILPLPEPIKAEHDHKGEPFDTPIQHEGPDIIEFLFGKKTRDKVEKIEKDVKTSVKKSKKAVDKTQKKGKLNERKKRK